MKYDNIIKLDGEWRLFYAENNTLEKNAGILLLMNWNKQIY